MPSPTTEGVEVGVDPQQQLSESQSQSQGGPPSHMLSLVTAIVFAVLVLAVLPRAVKYYVQQRKETAVPRVRLHEMEVATPPWTSSTSHGEVA